MPHTIVYHSNVEDDIELLDKKQKNIIARAIENRLVNEPEKYGKPLRGSLKGYWKLRIRDIRVIFEIVKNEVQILGVINRKLVYEKILKRL